jgi:uncharacterized membrane protein
LAAGLKDILDFSGATGILIPLVLIATFLASIFIWMMVLLGVILGGGGAGVQRKMIKKGLVLIFGTTGELLLGLNFLPIETLSVAIIYMLTLSERAQIKMETA